MVTFTASTLKVAPGTLQHQRSRRAQEAFPDLPVGFGAIYDEQADRPRKLRGARRPDEEDYDPLSGVGRNGGEVRLPGRGGGGGQAAVAKVVGVLPAGGGGGGAAAAAATTRARHAGGREGDLAAHVGLQAKQLLRPPLSTISPFPPTFGLYDASACLPSSCMACAAHFPYVRPL